MRTLILTLLFFTAVAWCSAAVAEDFVYEGWWHTTNRKLDGTMTCVVTELGRDKWQGRFYGNWQGVAFDYPVTFTGPASQAHGTAIIDGAQYTWTGAISHETPGWFKGTFGGSRYEGYFDLKERTEAGRFRTFILRIPSR